MQASSGPPCMSCKPRDGFRSVDSSHRLGLSAPESFKKELFDQKSGTKTGRLAKELLDLKGSALRAGIAGFEAVNRLLERAEAEAEINSAGVTSTL